MGSLLVLLAALVLGFGQEHGPTARSAHPSRVLAASPAAETLDGSACLATERWAPDPDAAAGDLDCPPAACAAVVPRPGELVARQAGVSRHPEWPGSGPVTSHVSRRLERPPRAA
jgi:hypothetical protein